jgi:glycosyltransferase involved in cell wall biosynthesis
MSVFKWEPRKGWHGLMEAYYRAFYSPLYTNRTKSTKEREPMLIVVGSSYTPKADTYESIFLSQRVNSIAKRQRWPIASPTNTSHVILEPDYVGNYAGRADFPCMCLVAEAISEEELTALYRSVDAFVITTRGEGWGLPISEAMAMGLPTISTDWGGSTEFTSHGSMPAAVKATRHEMPVSYPINASIVEVPQLADGYGGEHNMRMAAPSVPHTVELLRKVYEQTPEVNQEVGRRARDVIVRQFSQAATTDMMTVRLAAVAQKLRWESAVEDEAASETQNSRLKVSIML